MRGLTSTLILVVLLAGLGGYIYFVDSKRPATTSVEGETPRTKVFSIDTEKITDLTVTYQGETSVLRKNADGWTMVEPSTTGADAAEAIAISQALANIESSRTIDEKPAKLSEYGLESPAVTVAFRAEGGATGTLKLGDKTAMQGDMYAMKDGSPAVFLVPAYQETTFAKKVFDLRDKKILKFDRDKADALAVTRGTDHLELARDGSSWAMKEPWTARGDYSGIEGLFTRLSTANMTTLVEADAKDLAKYGLDKPSAVFTVGAGSATSTLEIGKTEDDKTYARDVSRPMVFTIDTTLQEDVKKPFSDYRRKEFFEFRPFSVQRLRTVLDAPGGRKAYDFEKAPSEKATDPDKWKVTINGSTHEVPQTAMDDVLGRLADLKATGYVDAKVKTGLDTPALVVSASYDDGKFERVRFGEVGGSAYALREGETGPGTLDQAALAGALQALDAAVMPPAPSATPTPATTEGAKK